MQQTSKSNGIVFINLPEDFNQKMGNFNIKSNIPIPVQLPDDHKELTKDDVSVERIIAGMLKIIAWQPEHEHFSYYKEFILSTQPECVEQLNLAAIAKEKKEDYDFSEELFLIVNHLEPQASTFINLATHYAKRATVAEDTDGKNALYDYFQQKTLDTLTEGVQLFNEDPDLLCELGYFHIYQKNIEAARDYLEKFIKVATDDDKRKERVSNILKDINSKLTSDAKLLQAYDEIQLCNEEKAIELLNDYIKENDEVWNAYFFKGWALRRKLKFAEAKECFLECIKLGESNSEIYNELSICALEEGHRELAIFYLDSALDLQPDDLKILTNLAYLKLEDKDFDKVRYLLEKARVIDEKDPLVKHLCKEYCKTTGETLSDIIVEEVVDDVEAFEEENKEKEDN